MKALTIFGFLTLSIFSYSQERFVSMSGQIVDLKSDEPLSFATINIKGTQNGVVTNEEGYFDFSFPESYSSDSITASMVGYEKLTLPIKPLLKKEFVELKMTTKPFMLEEVVVTPGKELQAAEIIELVRKNIPSHYPQKPFVMEAFYRDYKVEDGRCVGLLEASVSIYDKGYKKTPNPHSLQEKVKLNQVRKSLSNDFKGNVLTNQNIMKGFLSLNDIRYRHRWLSKRFKKHYQYEKDGYAFINEKLHYVIKATSSDWAFKIYVEAENFMVPKIEMSYEWEDDVLENEWTLYDSIRIEQRWAKEILEFQEIDGQWLPKVHLFQFNNVTYDIKTNEKLAVTEVRQEFLVNHVDLDDTEKIQKAERMDEYQPLHLQAASYDAEFWKNYNVIKLHPRDKKLIKDLEDRMNIEEQFSTTNE